MIQNNKAPKNAVRSNQIARRSGLALALTLLAFTGYESLQANPHAQNAVRARQDAATVRQSATQASQLVSGEVRRKSRLFQNNLDARQTRGSTLWNDLHTKDSTARRYNEAEELLREAAELLQPLKSKLQALPDRVTKANKNIQDGDRRVAQGDNQFRRGRFGQAQVEYKSAKNEYTNALQKFAAIADTLTEIANALSTANNKLNAAKAIIDTLPDAPAMGTMPVMGSGSAPATGSTIMMSSPTMP